MFKNLLTATATATKVIAKTTTTAAATAARFKATPNAVAVTTSDRLMCYLGRQQQQQQQQQHRRGLHLYHHPLQRSSRPLFPVNVNTNINNNNKGRRHLSFYSGDSSSSNSYSNNSNPNMGNPSYIVYGEEIAFSVKAIPPEFRALPSGTVVLDASKRGRLMFEWTPLSTQPGYGDKKSYAWDKTTRFALTAEEIGSLLARLDRGDTSVEYTRRIGNDNYQNSTGLTLDKIFIAKLIDLQEQEQDQSVVVEKGGAGAGSGSGVKVEKKNDGISLLIDYVDADTGHQFGNILHPPSEIHDGVRGPFEIRLMVGEYRVLRSIIEYSIPKLIGWSTMFDKNIEQSITKSINTQQGGGGGGGSSNNNNNNRGVGGGGFGGSSPHNYN
jgi:hypothetical protein